MKLTLKRETWIIPSMQVVFCIDNQIKTLQRGANPPTNILACTYIPTVVHRMWLPSK